ncbi:MAG: serine/threonine-protein kinase [Planctomycetota bacterium]
MGDYTLEGEIARGGMSAVYKAVHQTLGREVALKVILSGQLASENEVRRFHMEAESAASLDHPGIVPIYEIGEQDGHHFFTMKLIEGGSLATRMGEIRDDIRGAIAMLASVAEAIDYAHKRGILHRDIKPANILIDEDGNPLVTDLGLAKQIQSESDLTGTGAIVGTPAYMSPEQASASNEMTTGADVYSMGAILYECLTGRPPHQAESAIATLMLAAKGEIDPPSRVVKQVDRTLELICMKTLAADPAERYASAALFAKDLRHWLAGETVSVRPKSFAHICGDLLANQLRSAIGAMMLGIVGGVAMGVPVYGGLAARLFHSDLARFSPTKLQGMLPDVPVFDPWWLHPPSFLAGPVLFLGLLLCFFLGPLVVRLVKPETIQHALAVGLVAGLLMAIVEFGLYGVAASWNTFALVSADEVRTLATAGFGDETARQESIKAFFDQYAGLDALEPAEQADAVSKLVSMKIMLSTPPVALGTLSACLIFASVFCVFATLHAYRLLSASFSWINRSVRYTEVVTLLALAGVSATMTMFTVVGMLGQDRNKSELLLENATPGVYLVLLALPGWFHCRWYIRWGLYGGACGLLYMLG